MAVNWSVTTDDSDPRFVIHWREWGGPTVTPPQHQGFGRSVVVRMVEHALDAEADLAFASTGLDWRVNAPARVVLDGLNEASVQ